MSNILNFSIPEEFTSLCKLDRLIWDLSRENFDNSIASIQEILQNSDINVKYILHMIDEVAARRINNLVLYARLIINVCPDLSDTKMFAHECIANAVNFLINPTEMTLSLIHI